MNVSVVVPFKRADEYLLRCVENLLDQEPPAGGWELVMVNNGFADVAAELVRRYPAIRIFSEPGGGPYAARNRGAAEAQGSLIVFTDADCEPARDWLRQIVAAFAESEAGVVVGQVEAASSSRLLALLAAYEEARGTYVMEANRPELYFGYAGNMAVRRDVWEENGPFVERRRGADTLFVRQVARRRRCPAVRYALEARVRHLEVRHLGAYYRKLFIYGRSAGLSHWETVDGHPPGIGVRLAIYRRAVRLHAMGPARALALLLLLVAGGACWSLGYRRGAMMAGKA